MSNTISEECKLYEKFAISNWQDPPFPMSKSKLIQYIKYRARCSTFTTFLTHLDKHPTHGPEWFNTMNNDAEVKKIMQFSINLWPRQSKTCPFPLIGTAPSNKKKSPQELQNEAQLEKVRVIQGPKAKGFMVTHDPLDGSISNPVAIQPTKLSSSELYMPSLKNPQRNIPQTNIVTIEDDDNQSMDYWLQANQNSKSGTENDENISYADLNDFEVDLDEGVCLGSAQEENSTEDGVTEDEGTEGFEWDFDVTAMDAMLTEEKAKSVQLEQTQEDIELEVEKEKNEPVVMIERYIKKRPYIKRKGVEVQATRVKEEEPKKVIHPERTRHKNRESGLGFKTRNKTSGENIKPKVSPSKIHHHLQLLSGNSSGLKIEKRPIGRPRKDLCIPHPKVIISTAEFKQSFVDKSHTLLHV